MAYQNRHETLPLRGQPLRGATRAAARSMQVSFLQSMLLLLTFCLFVYSLRLAKRSWPPSLLEAIPLKVVSAILGRNKNDHIHLIFPHHPLAARPISRPSKKRVSVGSLCSYIVHKNKWYNQRLKTKINGIPTNHRQAVGVAGLCAASLIVFTGCTKHGRGGASWLCWFGIWPQIPTEVRSPSIAETTFKSLVA